MPGPVPRPAGRRGLSRRALLGSAAAWPAAALPGIARAYRPAPPPAREVRGTWLTTTANGAIASPGATAQTMQRLRAIGLNTVYVESWKNGYTQFPSEVLRRTVGVAQRPAAARQDPSDAGAEQPPRDLLEETLIEAHRQGLAHVAWFEYGFMAAHGGTMNHLRRLKPEWLSRDRDGGEVAPNGFVWMNPLHPQARRFLLDLMLEAIARYDLDGVQLDDRIVWPYVTMGYDDFTRAAYAAAHGGRDPPADPREPGWMSWRADRLDALALEFVQELRRARPGLLMSLSPAPYPWSWEHYLLRWPQWARWSALHGGGWDEFVPQAYRTSFEAFERTWLEQIDALADAGAYRSDTLLAGIRIDGTGPPSGWDQLQASIELARRQRNGGHVLWFSRGVLELYPQQLADFYGGPVPSPRFPPGWRQPARPLQPLGGVGGAGSGRAWALPEAPAGRWRVIGHDGRRWSYLQDLSLPGPARLVLPAAFSRAELLVDRRGERRDAADLSPPRTTR